MTRIALALPPAVADRITHWALRDGHDIVARVTGGSELAQVVVTMRPDVAIVSAEVGYLSDSILASCDSVGVRLLALVGSDTQRRHASLLGVLETVDAAADWSAIEPLLRESTQSALESAASGSSGSVIAVWGPSGAPGRTTLAIGIAAELAALGLTVALVDADTHGAAVAPTLGMLDESPGFAAACRLAGSDSLSSREFERVAQRYESRGGGFWVLTGIGQPSRWPELSGDRVASAISQSRSWVEFTVVDLSSSLENDEEISSDLLAPRRNAAAITAVRHADRVIAVGAADPVGLSRFLRAYGEVADATNHAELSVVINKVRAAAIGANPSRQLTQTLSRFAGIEAPVFVPHDQPALDSALLSGRTLLDVAAKSPARVAIKSLVESHLAPRRVSRRRSRR